jgi:hypothetical protein
MESSKKPDLQNFDTRSAQHDRIAACYRPAICSRHLPFNALSFQQGKIRHVSKMKFSFLNIFKVV